MLVEFTAYIHAKPITCDERPQVDITSFSAITSQNCCCEAYWSQHFLGLNYCEDIITFWPAKQSSNIALRFTVCCLMAKYRTDLIDEVQLTTELAHGKNIPRQNRPRIGPPTVPKIFKATWSSNKIILSAHLMRNVVFCLITQAVSSPVEPNRPWGGWGKPWPDIATRRT